jgi:hypothetical protein
MEIEAEKSKQCPCKCGKCAAAILITLLIAGIVCWHVHHPSRHRLMPKPGMECVIQLRRDALGAGSDIPVSPITYNRNGADVMVRGEMIAVNREAILISSGPNRFWIPKSNILLIEYQATPE